MREFVCIGIGILIAISLFGVIDNFRSKSASTLQIILSALWVFLLLTVLVEVVRFGFGLSCPMRGTWIEISLTPCWIVVS